MSNYSARTKPGDPRSPARPEDAPERDYLERTIATVRNHRDAENCWPSWANIFADEIERLWDVEAVLLAERDTHEQASDCPFCGHPWRQHDPEDGMCDSHTSELHRLGVCQCGRDLAWMQTKIAQLSIVALRGAAGGDRSAVAGSVDVSEPGQQPRAGEPDLTGADPGSLSSGGTKEQDTGGDETSPVAEAGEL